MTINSSKRCCSNKWSGTGELYPCQDSYIKMNARNTFENPLLLLINIKSVEIVFFVLPSSAFSQLFLHFLKTNTVENIKSHENTQQLPEDSICWFYIWLHLLACLQLVIRPCSGKYINCIVENISNAKPCWLRLEVTGQLMCALLFINMIAFV